MQQMSGADYAVEVKELQELIGSRFDKFYQCSDGTLRLKLKRRNSADIVTENGTRLHISEKFADSLETPPQFVMVVRKHLENAPLTAIEQLGSDRVIEFTFGTKKLIFELFAKGNCILVDEKEKIVDCLKREAYASRKIAPNQPYIKPPVGKKPFTEAEVEDLDGNGKAVALLSNKLSISSVYLEDAVAQCTTGRNAEKMDKKEKQRIIDAVHSVELNPTVYYKNGKGVAFGFRELKSLEQNESKAFSTFWQALDEYYANAAGIESKQEKSEVSVREKLQCKLEFQLQAQKEFEERASQAQKSAEFLYANFQLFEKLMETARKLGDRKKEKAEIATELEKIAVADGKKMKIKIGEKGEVEAEID